MDRSLYPDGVEVSQTNLANTESDRSFHIRQRHKDDSVQGVVSGFIVSVNTTDNTLIDVLAGTGYSPDDEYVELLSSQVSITLSDYALNTVNLVLAVYTETNDDLSAHETNGSSFATTANRSVRIVVLTQAEFDLLPQTDTLLSNNDIDRSLILAHITAQGISIALTSNNIISATEFGNALSATKASNNITGTVITSIDKTTTPGNGLLSFISSSSEITWAAPGDTAGAAVNISVSGETILISNNGNTITILVVSVNLPTSDQTDTVVVTDIYSQTVNSHTSDDSHHRSLIGTGIPTTSNPHGISISDLGGGDTSVEEHQDKFHANGIRLDSSASLLILASTVDTSASPDELDVSIPTTDEEVYISGVLHQSLASNTIQFTDIIDDRQAIYDIYMLEGSSGIASLEKRERVRYATIPAPDLSTVVQIIDTSPNTPAGTGVIEYTALDEISFKAPGDSNPGPSVSSVVGSESRVRLFNETGEYYIDVLMEDQATINGAISAPDPEDLTFTAIPTAAQLESRLRLSTIMFSGSATGFLGSGFGAGNSPNAVEDHRLFGLTGPNDLRDDINFSSVDVFTRFDIFDFQAPSITSLPKGMSTNNWIAIGHTKPEGQIHVIGTTGLPARMILERYTGIVTEGSEIAQRTSGGTPASKIDILAAQVLGEYNTYGFMDFGFRPATKIRSVVDVLGASSFSTTMQVFTSDVSSVSRLRLSINGIGNLVLGTGTPASVSAGIDIQGTTKALLLSRLNTTQRDALTEVEGMIVFNTTTNTVQFVNNALAWGDI